MIKLAIVGTGGMANNHVENYKKIPGCKVTAACDLNAERAQSFAANHGIPHFYGDINKLFQEGNFDAISNVTPDGFHTPISLLAIKHGKHVLCEKPLATNYPDARKMAVAANKQGIINMVNFSYRNSAAIHHAHKLVQAGVLGRILHVEGAYLQSWLSQSEWGDWRTAPAWLWRLSTEHGSKGVLGDVGVHLIDFASYPVGVISSVNCRLKTFPKVPENKIKEYVLDANDSAIMTLEFAHGALGSLRTTRWATGQINTVTLSVFGEEGALKIDLDQPNDQMELCLIKKTKVGPWKKIQCPKTPNIYERFIRSIRQSKNDQPDFTRGAEVQKVLDACIQSDKTGRTIKIN